MRDIKFRAWDKKGNKFRGINGTRDLFSIRCDGFCHEDYVLMQYTGLKDKNGVEIYEGDVVRLDRINHKVIYDPAIFRLADKEGLFTTSGYPDWDLCEVIGNIYEHPNLLDKDA